jgi:regulator of sigma E protease
MKSIEEVSFLAIVLSLLLVVGLHEAGHAVAAHWCGVKVKCISIGFGKPLFQWQRNNGVEWVWALWPFGGYAQLLNTRIEPVPRKQQRYCFDKKKTWQKIFILAAGALVNVLVAWLAFLCIHLSGYQQTIPNILNITPASVAANAGFQPGDRFMAIDGENTPSWKEVGMQLILALGKSKVSVLVKQATGAERSLLLDMTQWQFKGGKNALLGGLGIQPNLSNSAKEIVPPSSLMQACSLAYSQMLSTILFFILVLKQMFTGAVPFAVLVGPLGIFAAMADSLHQGIIVFLYFIATLSITVAIINLLPIPGLDGGSILYALIEKIRGKPVSIAMEILLHRLVSIVVVLLLIQLLLNDLKRYIH